MKARNYKYEYKRDQASAKSKKDRASRNKARRNALAQNRVRKGDGKEVHHKGGNPRNNSPKNLKVISRSSNRKKK